MRNLKISNQASNEFCIFEGLIYTAAIKLNVKPVPPSFENKKSPHSRRSVWLIVSHTLSLYCYHRRKNIDYVHINTLF